MRRARGMTLVEIMIALVLSGLVLAAAVKFFKAMNISVAGTVDRLDAMQNLRYGVQTVDRELRVAGAGTVETQPTLVYIGSAVVTFNADLVSATANSPTAVYYNPDVDPNASNEATLAQRFTIPTTAVQYPDSTYRSSGGMISPAETITYFFVSDTGTARGEIGRAHV